MRITQVATWMLCVTGLQLPCSNLQMATIFMFLLSVFKTNAEHIFSILKYASENMIKPSHKMKSSIKRYDITEETTKNNAICEVNAGPTCKATFLANSGTTNPSCSMYLVSVTISRNWGSKLTRYLISLWLPSAKTERRILQWTQSDAKGKIREHKIGARAKKFHFFWNGKACEGKNSVVMLDLHLLKKVVLLTNG